MNDGQCEHCSEYDEYSNVCCARCGRRIEHDPHPMQQIRLDDGQPRFRENALVRKLLNSYGMNNLVGEGSREDWAQLAQLIGYSVSGYGDLSYALGVEKADALASSLVNGGVE